MVSRVNSVDMVDGALLFEDATAQAAALREGRVSSVELTAAVLDRIDEVDDVLRSYVTVDREGHSSRPAQPTNGCRPPIRTETTCRRSSA